MHKRTSTCISQLLSAYRYITQAELGSVSSYMRGRLTIETVNAALDEAAAHSEANSRLMSAARQNSVKPADRKRATTLLHCVAVGLVHACTTLPVLGNSELRQCISNVAKHSRAACSTAKNCVPACAATSV